MRKITPAFLALLMSCSSATSPEMIEADVDEIMHEYSGTGSPGASVLVFRDGRPIFRKSYGLADVAARTAATSHTNYRLASITKQFTAAAILILEGKGTLSLDDAVRTWLPSLPSETQAVTIRHLLTHSSGLIDYEDVIPHAQTVQLRDADVLRLLESQRTLYFAPGTSYRYSNSGYALLALVVEKASGRGFAGFLREEIFAPNGMTATVALEEGTSTVSQRAFGHSREGTSWKRTDQSVTSAVLGDGGVYSSLDDLSRWLAALDRGAFAEASVPRVATDDEAVKYGYGWRISSHQGRRTVLHTGETIGFRNALVRFPDERLSIVVLTNRDEGRPLDLALAIAARLG
jgi:CubicO group peptidase (beta-lactamase class C family)